MKRTSFTSYFTLALLCLSLAAHAQAVAVTVTDLNPVNCTRSEAHAVSGGRQVGYGVGADGSSHALLWRGTAASVVDLHPDTFAASSAGAVSGGTQAGTGTTPPDTNGNSHSHALFWEDTAASAVDLHPSGFTDSYASGAADGTQVGYGTDANGNPHALLWKGTPDSVTDLTPAGFSFAAASGVSGGTQVGYGAVTDVHALLWRGTAASAVDLNPAGFSTSFAQGVSGTAQVGQGYNGSSYHALLWHGTAASMVDLNPAGYVSSSAYAASGTVQVGSGSVYDPATGYTYAHALLWRGAAAGTIDLSAALPNGFNTVSEAYGVDGTDSAVLVAGYGAGTKGRHAFLWRVTFLTVSSLSPSAALAGGGAFTLTVNGANFAPSSLVKWNGMELATAYVSSAKLTASVPASLIASAGTAKVSVVTPHVASSGTKTFTINPRPVLSSLSPSTRKAGAGAFTLTVNGTGFLSSTLVKWNGTELTTHDVSSTQLTAFVPASLTASAGKASVTVVTPHIASSGTKTFTVTP